MAFCSILASAGHTSESVKTTARVQRRGCPVSRPLAGVAEVTLGTRLA